MNAAITAQGAFASALLATDGTPPEVRAGPDAPRRFAVHRNNVMSALTEGLAATFPVVRDLVGEDFFAGMAREHVRLDPPRSPVMALYGEGFADFIAAHAPIAHLPWLADVARLEYLRVQAFHAADADPIDPASLSSLVADPQRLAATCVGLQPACRWLSSASPVLSIWQAHQQPAAARDAALAALDLDAAEDVLLHRPCHDVQQAVLPAGGVAWLQALAAGMPFGEAVQHASTRSPDSSPPALFALLLQHGLVVSLQTHTEPCDA